MGSEYDKTPEVVATENRSFQPEAAEVKTGNGYQPEVVETVKRNAYQPEAVEANRNEYVRSTPESIPVQTVQKPVVTEWNRSEEEKTVKEVPVEEKPVTEVPTEEKPVETIQVNESPLRTENIQSPRPEVAPPPYAPVKQQNPTPEPQRVVPPAQVVRPAPQAPQKQKEKKERKGPNFFVKALMAVAFGILFGIFAGVSFFAIKVVGDKVYPGASGGLIGGAGNEPASEIQTSEPASEIETSESVVTAVEVPANQSNIVDVAKECMPSIVIINVVVEQNYYGMVQDAPGSGSGIIVGQNDEELFIATNYHVIADAKTVDVQFCDGSTAPAVVKGKKVNMDLAVITVDISSLGNSTMTAIKIAKIGDSDNLEVGETAIAIGNALGYGQSVTVGVISALDREVATSSGETNRFIQTDAAINPGNSGGALINTKGEVIGINSNKLGGSAVEGMGYAIPITTAQPIIEKLIAKQELVALPEDQQSYFGITGSEVKSGLYTNEGVSIPNGIYVNSVQPGTPAEEAGIQKNDIITEFEGDSVTTMNELLQYLAAYPAGSKVKITFRRYENFKFEEHEVEVTLQNKSLKPKNP